MQNITESIKNIGAKDLDIDLFEGQYPLEHGMLYNSYLIDDEKVAILDTVDKHVTEEWFDNLEKALNGKTPDYLIISHMEPDHSANIGLFVEKYPNVTLIASKQAFAMLGQFENVPENVEKMAVKEGDTLTLGKHTLHFIAAPMIHWPEVIMTYESTEKVLFSADAFGKFGAEETTDNWLFEARDYYTNIVGKYGSQVQSVLKKAATLDIETICALHGPVLKENLGYYIDLYDKWSSYKPESNGVLIVYGTVYGHTEKAAIKVKEILEKNGVSDVCLFNLSKEDVSEALSLSFKYGKIVMMSTTYDGGLFPPMETYICHLKSKAIRNKRIALVENGSWAPIAAKIMKDMLEGLKNVDICDKTVTIKTSMTEENIKDMETMVKELI